MFAVDSVAQSRHIRQQRLRRQLNLTCWCAQDLGDTRLERPQIKAVRLTLQTRQREPARPRTEAITVWPDTQKKIQQTLRPSPRSKSRQQFGGIMPCDRRPFGAN